ncbi:MAG TPA: acyl-CoA dehydrogenase [Alphaproteobacteria bacterium]|nr:acyl-CoA dehydrogenase [Alphaproteobacteria bacterium]
MDFAISPELERARQKVRTLVHDEIIPLESDPANYDSHGNINHDALGRMRARAKQEQLWSPQMPKERGGLGWGPVGMSVLYEEMNHSIFGPVSFNCAAPDDGNMYVPNKLGTEEQKSCWLDPIIDGKVRSAFVMTEPHPGGGSDPGMMMTRATRENGKWVVRGHKWYITGAEEAEHFILMARTGDGARDGLTAFLFHRDEPGWEITRRIGIMGPEEHGGHCELVFDGLTLDDDRVLMGEGKGLKVTQVRLGLARLTHCMRWLGLARRCVQIASDYAAERKGFGIKLADRESIQIKLGKAAMDIDMGRLLVMRAAWKLEQGSKARQDISMAKIHVSETLNRVASDMIQICGAKGYSTDTVLEWVYRYARQALLVDGATEVHQMVINRFLQAEHGDFWQWGKGHD